MNTLELTDDERTVLMIAAQGESMIPIGRWEQPIEHLVELGYLHRFDQFNNAITDSGRKAIETANDAVDTVAAKALIKGHNARVPYKEWGEDIAAKLVEMAREASAATGDDLLQALRKCVAAVSARAIEQLR